METIKESFVSEVSTATPVNVADATADADVTQKLEDKVTSCHVVYVKLPIYIGQYIRDCFHARLNEGIVIPRLTSLMFCLKNSLYENRELYRQDSRTDDGNSRDAGSYSEAAYKIAVSAEGKSPIIPFPDMKIPEANEIPRLFPFVIPKSIWLNRGSVETNDHYELTLIGAREFRKMCDEFFWSSLRAYVVSEQRDAKYKGKNFSQLQTIQYFMRCHSIDLSNTQAVIRGYSKKSAGVPKNFC